MSSAKRDEDKERFWQRTIRRQRRSGLSIRAFCEEAGLSEGTFHYWQRKLDGQDDSETETPASSSKNPSAQQTASFLPIQVAGDQITTPPADCLEVTLPSGTTLRVPGGFDPETLTAVFALLEVR